MIEDYLLPSPNWYCSQASGCSEDGLFAYATRNVVFLLDVRTNPPCFVGCLGGHSDRVTAVHFGVQSQNKHLCATAGDDGCIKVWDVRNRALVNEHHFHDESKVTTIQLCDSARYGSVIVSGDEKGALIWWNHTELESKEYIPEKRSICSLAGCPHDEGYIAVGYKIGLVLIVNNKGDIIHKLRGHDDEVQSLCWSPVLGENIRQNENPEETSLALETSSDRPRTLRHHGCFLISGSRDRTIRLWNFTQGKAVMTMNLPSRAGVYRSRDRGEEGVKSRVWLGLYWPADKPRQFISSSYGGDVILWDLCKPGKQKFDYFAADEKMSHNRIVFNIIGSGMSTPGLFITTSMDREIICWNATSLKPVWSLATLGGFVYSLSSCPVDPGCLAVGVGDSMIRIWNTMSSGRGCIVSRLWQGIKSKITSLSWHPERDNCLAYGTEDGRVGVYNTFNQGKAPSLSSTFHKKTVYTLCWGPQCPVKGGGALYCMYSCGGDGAIYQHDPTRLREEAANLNSLIRSTNQIAHILPLRTDLSWSADWKVIAIGNEDGSIEVLAAPTMLLVCTIQVHHKIINCLQWYPNCSQSDAVSLMAGQSGCAADVGVNSSGVSVRGYWLASGSNEPQVHVHDLTSLLGVEELIQQQAPITSSFRTLNGHTLRITALSWSCHGDGRLVSASYDGTAQVWDVSKGEPIANFRGHFGRLFSVQWSGLDPDVIYSGGEDFCLLKWRVSKLQHNKPPTNKRSTNTLMPRRTKTNVSSKKKKKPKSSPVTAVEHDSSPSVASGGQANHRPVPADVAVSIAKELPSIESVSDVTPIDTCELERLLEEKRILLENLSAAESKSNFIEEDDTRSETLQAAAQLDSLENTEDDDIETTITASTVGEECDVKTKDFKKDYRRKKKSKSLFPLSRSQDNRGKCYQQEDCIALAQHQYTSTACTTLYPGVGDNVHLGLFADRRAAYAMFNEEGKHLEDTGSRDQRQYLEMWKGNLAGSLTQATQANQLNSFLVAMAPLGGYDVWLETVEAFARQLALQEDYVQAATYYLACHKIHAAIAVLQDNKLFREAIALATVRLSPFDDAFTNVYLAWASHLESEGNYGQAAKCYLAINRPADAAMLLARKGDAPSLGAALRVACISDQRLLLNSLMVRYLHECLMAGDWLEAQGLLAIHKSTLCGSLVATLHEVLVANLTRVHGVLNQNLFAGARTNAWIQAIVPNSPPQVADDLLEWCTPSSGRFVEHVIETWFQQQGQTVSDVGTLLGFYDAIDNIRQHNNQWLQTKQLLIGLAFEVTQGQVAIMMGCASKAVSHWLQAVVMCYNANDVTLAKGILTLILPEGIRTIGKLQNPLVETSAQTAAEAEVESLNAYYQFTVLYDLWWEVGNWLYSIKASSKGDVKGTSDNGNPIMDESSHTSMSCAKTSDPLQDSSNYNDESTFDFSNLTKTMVNKNLSDDTMGERAECLDLSQMDQRSVGYANKLLEKITKIYPCLLSEPHSKLRSLQERLRCVQLAMGKLVERFAMDGRMVKTDGLTETKTEPTANSEQVINRQGFASTAATSSDGQIVQGQQELLSQGNAENDINETATDETLKPVHVSTVASKALNQPPNDDVERFPRMASDTSVLGPMSSDFTLPEDWASWLADVKYAHPAVNYAVLVKEQELLLQELKTLEETYAHIRQPFPDSMEAALVLVHLCHSVSRRMAVSLTTESELDKLAKIVALWGMDNCWLTSQIDIFRKYLLKMDPKLTQAVENEAAGISP